MRADGGSGPQSFPMDTEYQKKVTERDAIRDMMTSVKRRIIEEIEHFQMRFNQRTQEIVQRYTELQ